MYGLDAAVEGWQPDLMTFGKVIGGGLPVGAFGGRADIMALLAPDRARSTRPARCPGIRSRPRPGWPPCSGCDDAVYRHLDETAVRGRRSGVGRADARRACRTGCSGPATCSRCSSPTGQVATTTRPARQSTAAYAAFFHGMLDAGVYLPPSAFEAWFVSAAHDDDALDRIAAALPGAARAAAAALARLIAGGSTSAAARGRARPWRGRHRVASTATSPPESVRRTVATRRGRQRLQQAGIRMTVAVVGSPTPITATLGAAASRNVRQRVRGPVVRHLEHVRGEVGAAAQERPLRVELDVPGEQDSHAGELAPAAPPSRCSDRIPFR